MGVVISNCIATDVIHSMKHGLVWTQDWVLHISCEHRSEYCRVEALRSNWCHPLYIIQCKMVWWLPRKNWKGCAREQLWPIFE